MVNPAEAHAHSSLLPALYALEILSILLAHTTTEEASTVATTATATSTVAAATSEPSSSSKLMTADDLKSALRRSGVLERTRTLAGKIARANGGKPTDAEFAERFERDPVYALGLRRWDAVIDLATALVHTPALADAGPAPLPLFAKVNLSSL